MQLEFLAISGADGKQLAVAVIGILALLYLIIFLNSKKDASIRIERALNVIEKYN